MQDFGDGSLRNGGEARVSAALADAGRLTRDIPGLEDGPAVRSTTGALAAIQSSRGEGV